MYLVDEKYLFVVPFHVINNGLEPLLEIPPVPRPRCERPHVEGVNGGVPERLRNLVFRDPEGEPLGYRRLPDAGVPDEYGVILPPPGEYVYRAVYLGFAADERVQLSVARLLYEVCAEFRERILRSFLRLRVRLGDTGGFFLLLVTRPAVRYISHEVVPVYALLVQKIHGVRLIHPEHGDEYVPPVYLQLVGRLRMHGCQPKNIVAPCRVLGLRQVFGVYRRHVLVDKILEARSQALEIDSASGKNLRSVRVVGQLQQDVLQRYELVPPGLGLLVRPFKCFLQFP